MARAASSTASTALEEPTLSITSGFDVVCPFIVIRPQCGQRGPHLFSGVIRTILLFKPYGLNVLHMYNEYCEHMTSSRQLEASRILILTNQLIGFDGELVGEILLDQKVNVQNTPSMDFLAIRVKFVNTTLPDMQLQTQYDLHTNADLLRHEQAEAERKHYVGEYREPNTIACISFLN